MLALTYYDSPKRYFDTELRFCHTEDDFPVGTQYVNNHISNILTDDNLSKKFKLLFYNYNEVNIIPCVNINNLKNPLPSKINIVSLGTLPSNTNFAVYEYDMCPVNNTELIAFCKNFNELYKIYCEENNIKFIKLEYKNSIKCKTVNTLDIKILDNFVGNSSRPKSQIHTNNNLYSLFTQHSYLANSFYYSIGTTLHAKLNINNKDNPFWELEADVKYATITIDKLIYLRQIGTAILSSTKKKYSRLPPEIWEHIHSYLIQPLNIQTTEQARKFLIDCDFDKINKCIEIFGLGYRLHK
jgi:hypothetical protein